MIKYTLNIVICIFIGAILSGLSVKINSSYLLVFMRANSINIILTLFAIIIATLGLLSTKIQEIYIQYKKADFSKTIKEMEISLIEQIVVLIISVILLIIDSSTLIRFCSKEFYITALLSAFFMYEIFILWDTGKSVFIMIDNSKKIK